MRPESSLVYYKMSARCPARVQSCFPADLGHEQGERPVLSYYLDVADLGSTCGLGEGTMRTECICTMIGRLGLLIGGNILFFSWEMFSFWSKRSYCEAKRPSSEMTMELRPKLVCNNFCILKEIGNLCLFSSSLFATSMYCCVTSSNEGIPEIPFPSLVW